MVALPHRIISAIAKRITASLEFRCGDARFISSSTGELTVKFLELLVLDPSSKPSSLQLFGEAGADAITAAIENDPLKASQRKLFQLEALRHSLLTPVVLPSGRASELTSPDPSISPTIATIGMVFVAC